MAGQRHYWNNSRQHLLHYLYLSAKIHSMGNSAISSGGLRERKRAATRAAITAVARSLTAERGLSGYTVEEVCERAGIFPEEVVARFMAGGAGSPAGEISASLLADLVRLSLDLSERMSGSEEETRQLIGVIKKEPQLMRKIIGATEEREADFARLLAAREGVAADHPVVRMAVVLLGNVARKTSADYFSEGNARPYKDMLLENIAAARTLFSLPFTMSQFDTVESNTVKSTSVQPDPSEGAQ